MSLIGWSAYQHLHGISFWPVPLAFGIISIGFGFSDVKFYIKGAAYKQHWLAGHIVSMGAGYIATWTAFVVTNVTFLPPVIVWLAPAAIGSFFISYSVRRYVKTASPKLIVQTS